MAGFVDFAELKSRVSIEQAAKIFGLQTDGTALRGQTTIDATRLGQ
jgi:hypothetical protein